MNSHTIVDTAVICGKVVYDIAGNDQFTLCILCLYMDIIYEPVNFPSSHILFV